jgi:hypothetical protein
MGRGGWSDGAMQRYDDARSREIAYRERRKREEAQARKAVDDAWADWNTQEARARVMRLDVTAITPAEDAGWREIGRATAALIQLIEDELAQPYEDVRALDADAAGYGYRAGGPDSGDRGAGYDCGEDGVVIYLQEEME